jgi:hypothetical protein
MSVARIPGVRAWTCGGDLNASNIQIRGFGNGDKTNTAIRFRTSSPRAVKYGGDSARGSSLTGFLVQGGAGNATGVSVGSANVSVSNGFMADCATGMRVGGNAHGQAEAVSVLGVTASSCVTGFFVGGSRTRVVACTATDCATGFVNRGAHNEYHGCLSLRSDTAFVEQGMGETKRIGGNI